MPVNVYTKVSSPPASFLTLSLIAAQIVQDKYKLTENLTKEVHDEKE